LRAAAGSEAAHCTAPALLRLSLSSAILARLVV
jgi:hypothetical protein